MINNGLFISRSKMGNIIIHTVLEIERNNISTVISKCVLSKLFLLGRYETGQSIGTHHAMYAVCLF